MTALADVALVFARECLGWEDARTVYPNDKIYPGVYWADSAKQELCYNDLNTVLAAVLGWLAAGEQEDLGLVLQFTRHRKITAVVQNEAFLPAQMIAEIESDDPRHALLAACVESARKLKSAEPGNSNV